MRDQFVTVCCRADAEGGDLDAMRALRDAEILRGQGHLVFLVHGYNNTGPEEYESDRLRAGMLTELIPGAATSLYSGSDWVLADVFPVGETADLLHEGVAPTALGHAKWAPGDGLGLNQDPAINAQHRDYRGGDSK